MDGERRNSGRLPVVLRALYRSPAHVVDGVVSDLSPSGMFLSALVEKGMEERGYVEVDLPTQGLVRVDAEVVRVDNERGGVALRFTGGPEMRRPLANYLMRQSFWTKQA